LDQYPGAKIKTPKVADQSDLTQALARLAEAERAYSVGDDSKVFFACRRMIEALPGYPSDLFPKVNPNRKRKALGHLYMEAGEFFRVGRHVGKSGPQGSDIPVDHRDAGLALGLARGLLSYLSSK
jgi:hypothetical protein